MAKKAVNTMRKTVERISKIVNGLRSISYADDDLLSEPVNLYSVCKEVSQLCSVRFRKNSINFEIECSEEIVNLTISCRRAQLSQVILNLLNNACDAVKVLQDKWIKLSINIVANKIEIAVKDSGHGLPPQISEQVFDPFFSTKKMGQGTGLGLSISRGFVGKNEGKIFYEKRNGHTCFIIQFPLKASVIVEEPSFDWPA
jgi:hypothetical protein